jgi:hypothetical protein
MIIFLEQFGINYRESEAPKEADLEENEWSRGFSSSTITPITKCLRESMLTLIDVPWHNKKQGPFGEERKLSSTTAQVTFHKPFTLVLCILNIPVFGVTTTTWNIGVYGSAISSRSHGLFGCIVSLQL